MTEQVEEEYREREPGTNDFPDDAPIQSDEVEKLASPFSADAFEKASRETERLQRDLDITNADHIALWLEANSGDASLGWLACRIVEAHEQGLALAALSTRTDAPDREAIAEIVAGFGAPRPDHGPATQYAWMSALAKADAILAHFSARPNEASEDHIASAGKVIGGEASEREVTQADLIEQAVQAALDAGLAVDGEHGVAAARHAARFMATALASLPVTRSNKASEVSS